MLPSRTSTLNVGQTGEDDTNWPDTERVVVMHPITKRMVFIYVCFVLTPLNSKFSAKVILNYKLTDS